MSLVVLDRTLAQRMESLKKANAIRILRSQLKRGVTANPPVILHVLSDPAPEYGTMKVRNLLLALPKWGPSKVDRFLLTCRVSSSKTVGGMSGRQRGEMSDLLRARGIQ